jgi:hypothetical protein
MTEASRPKIGNLELNKETVQDLAEEAAERAEGGMITRSLWRQCDPTEAVSCICTITCACATA